MLINETISTYKSIFGSEPEVVVSAPGRVNLIGEHTDYNEGFVLPAAIDRRIVIAAGARSDDAMVLHALDFNESATLPLNQLAFRKDQFWSNYPQGVAHFLQRHGFQLSGMNVCIKGDIPRASGLSSSAAFEIASAHAFKTLNQLSIDNLSIIRLCQRAENEFVGVACGIMDQFISCLGKKDNAMFLDCRTLDYKMVPFPKGTKLVVCDTGLKRELAKSEYNLRRAECNEGVAKLSTVLPNISALRDVTLDDFHRYQHLLQPIVQKRCRHVISEDERVLESITALQENDIKRFGQLMYESHRSLKEDYEVSCLELDAIVEIARGTEGVFGARMTGAGFGGCAICLVDNGRATELIARLESEYPKRTRIEPKIYACSIEDGVTVYRL